MPPSPTSSPNAVLQMSAAKEVLIWTMLILGIAIVVGLLGKWLYDWTVYQWQTLIDQRAAATLSQQQQQSQPPLPTPARRGHYNRQ